MRPSQCTPGQAFPVVVAFNAKAGDTSFQRHPDPADLSLCVDLDGRELAMVCFQVHLQYREQTDWHSLFEQWKR